MNNLLKSPAGKILYLRVDRPVVAKGAKMAFYSITLGFDVKKDAAFLKQISEINDKQVVTSANYRGTQEVIKKLLAKEVAKVEFKSIFKPDLFDASGNELDASTIFPESKGEAKVITEVWNNVVRPIAIVIHSINNSEEAFTKWCKAQEERLNQIKEIIRKPTVYRNLPEILENLNEH